MKITNLVGLKRAIQVSCADNAGRKLYQYCSDSPFDIASLQKPLVKFHILEHCYHENFSGQDRAIVAYNTQEFVSAVVKEDHCTGNLGKCFCCEFYSSRNHNTWETVNNKCCKVDVHRSSHWVFSKEHPGVATFVDEFVTTLPNAKTVLYTEARTVMTVQFADV